MQTYIRAKLSKHEGQALWRSVFADVNVSGLLAPSSMRTFGKLGFLLVLLGAALAAGWVQNSFWILSAVCIGIALLLAQCAFIGHDAGHGAVSSRSAVNRTAGQISMTLVTGLAFDEWIGRHSMHHRYCQDEERDPDMMVDLVVSLTEKSRQRKGRMGRLITRYQAVHIWLLSLLFGHSQRHLSQAAVLCNVRRYPLDAVMLVFHFALWFGIPCLLLDVPLLTALLVYLLPLTILGPYLAAIFWVNHIGMPVIEKAEDFSFFEHQTITSRTIVNPPAWNWLFGGLNFQIEHHLFPQVPSSRLAAVQPIVRKHFDRNAIAYNGVSWPEAICSIAVHLRKIGRAQ